MSQFQCGGPSSQNPYLSYPLPPKIYSQGDAASRMHGGLIHVSMGYTPVKDRFHTRYSPVRRSPSAYCYAMLPLDLHVLSLSLAFILSQDQTLHGMNFICFFSCPGVPRRACGSSPTRLGCCLFF